MSNILKQCPIVLCNGKVKITNIDNNKKHVHFTFHKNDDDELDDNDICKYIMTSCAYIYNEGFIPSEEELGGWTTKLKIEKNSD